MRALTVGCAVLLTLACGKQGSRDTKVGYWGGSPPDPNVQLPLLPSPAPAQAPTPGGAAPQPARGVPAGGERSLPPLLAPPPASGVATRRRAGRGASGLDPPPPGRGLPCAHDQAFRTHGPIEAGVGTLVRIGGIGVQRSLPNDGIGVVDHGRCGARRDVGVRPLDGIPGRGRPPCRRRRVLESDRDRERDPPIHAAVPVLLEPAAGLPAKPPPSARPHPE